MSEVKLSDQVRSLFLEALCGLRRGRRRGRGGAEMEERERPKETAARK